MSERKLYIGDLVTLLSIVYLLPLLCKLRSILAILSPWQVRVFDIIFMNKTLVFCRNVGIDLSKSSTPGCSSLQKKSAAAKQVREKPTQQ